MRVAVPVAEFHRGNTAEYVARAFFSLGHDAKILSPQEFADSLSQNAHDLYFCVDSGKPFSFPTAHDLSRVSLWLIDYRHHWDGGSRTPGDLAVAKELTSRGGWVFQAQFEDVEHARSHGVERVSWLPLAADPEIWSDSPSVTKSFQLGFVGNVWDRARAEALQILINDPEISFSFPGHSALWMGEGAALLRRCQAGFNISSWFGTAHAFDLNMRVFETLSCGVPLITNEVPAVRKVFVEHAPFIRTFKEISEIPKVVKEALKDQDFLQSGDAGRKFILANSTYVHRIQSALAQLAEKSH